MNAALVAAWNEAVAPDDEVWVLGDVVMGGVAQHLPLVGHLHGHKILVPGNHDACWAGRGKGVERWTADYLAAGFAAVIQAPTSATVGGVRLEVDHFPYRGDSHGPDRYVDYRPADRGGWLLHGHVHERWRQQGRQLNVGVDAWAGRPAAEEELASLIVGGPQELPPLPWTGGR